MNTNEVLNKLIAEIERRRDSALERQKNLEKIGQETVLNEMIAFELNRLISFVASLQQEQPVEGLDVTDFCKPVDPGIAKCVANHWWELLDENAADKKAVKEIVKTVHKEVTRQVKEMVKEQPASEGLDNNGWIDCGKQMPKETKHWSDTLQGHREWTESDLVLAWDSVYGCRVDATKNGKWMSEQRGGYAGQICHGIIAWRPIPEYKEKQ